MTRQSISDLWDNSQEPKIHVNCSPKKVCVSGGAGGVRVSTRENS